MKVNFREKTVQSGQTFISPNIVKESVRLDRDGNEIDPRTKRIIKPVGKNE